MALGAAESGLTRCTLFPQASAAIIAEVSRHVSSAGWEVDQMWVESGRLEEVFRNVTTGAGAGAK